MQHDQLITIGIRPEYPETGYGYIMKGKAVAGNDANQFVYCKTIHREADPGGGATVNPPAFFVEQRHFRLESFHAAPASCPLSAGHHRRT